MKLHGAFPIFAGFLALAIVLAVSSPAVAQVPGNGGEDFEKQLNKELERLQQDIEQMLRQIAAQVPGAQAQGVQNIQIRNTINRNMRPGQTEDARLGSGIEKPSPALVDHLDLPKGQGMVLTNVKADSAAAKAGLKTNDILLEINGKSVPCEEPEYYKFINDIKAGIAVDAVVVRKGKKETVKGVTLPEGKADAGIPGLRILPAGNGFRGLIIPNIQGIQRAIPGNPGAGGLPGGLAQGMTVERKADGGWTSKYAEADSAITITGKTADGKTEVSEIEIKDGETTKKYQTVEAVPEKFREDVKYMIRRTEKTVGK